MISPGLLRLQEFAVSRDLGIELDLNIHEITVLHQLIIDGLSQSLDLVLQRVTLDVVVLLLSSQLVLKVTDSSLVALALKSNISKLQVYFQQCKF